MNTTIARCEKCHGIGEVPIGHVDMWGRSCWRVCPVCDGLGAVETDPEPTPPAPASMLEVGSYTVDAPGFTPDSFDRAVHRAHCDGLTVTPTDGGGCVLVTNPTNGAAHTVRRRQCSCMAGQRGLGCKHRALAIMFADILHTLPRPVTMPVAVAA